MTHLSMSRRLHRFVAALVTLVVLSWTPAASAGVILLSGDGNITTGLTDPGNQQFFRNILSGDTVLILQNSLIPTFDSFVDNFYDSQAGVSSSLFAGPVTDAALSGIDLFVSILPDAPFDASEIDALESFLMGGGSIFFLGENSDNLFTPYNNAINAALDALGSGMQILPNSTFDGSGHDAFPYQILPDPFTAGVATFRYAAPSQITGGTTLVTGVEGQPFVAYERNGGPVPTPEPGTILLLGVGLLAAHRRRRA